MVKISDNLFHPHSREAEQSDLTRRDALMELVHARADAHRARQAEYTGWMCTVFTTSNLTDTVGEVPATVLQQLFNVNSALCMRCLARR